MKIFCKLFLYTLLSVAAHAYAQPAREVLKLMVAQLQEVPGDHALRKRIIKFAAKIKPAPALPEEAEQFEGSAKSALLNAKSSADYLDVAKEYEKAVAAAPWVPGYYADLCTIYEYAEKFAEAKMSCEFFLASSPPAQVARNTRKHIAGLESAIKKVQAILDAEAKLWPGKVFSDCPGCPEMVIIPTGSFEMGSANGELDERPVHLVTINRFALGKTEVTQSQWRAIMGDNHSSFSDCGVDCPVELKTVKWDDVEAFIQKLNAKTDKQYRLPSEAEWEYACRAGGRHEYCGGDDLDSVAWYRGNSGNATNPVGRKQANNFGLHDMSGNVWEWVADNDHTDYAGAPTDGSVWRGSDPWRVLRGGAWNVTPKLTRSTFRLRCVPPYPSYFGFRLARKLP